MQDNSKKAKHSLEVPKSIIWTGKFLQFFSLPLAAKFAQNLFITPIKLKLVFSFYFFFKNKTILLCLTN